MASATTVVRQVSSVGKPTKGLFPSWGKTINLPAISLLVVLLALWELVVRVGVVTLTFLPAPSQIALSLAELTGSGELVGNVSHTLSAALLGWIIGSTLGTVVGAVVGVSSRAWTWTMASIDLLRSIPAITFVPVAALLLGFSLQMELVVTSYAALWPVLISMVEGLRKIPPLHMEVARTLHVGRIRRIVTVMFPGAAGSIIVGLRLALALALTLAVASEMVGNPHGAGYALIMQQQALNAPAMFAYILAIGLLGVVLNALLMLAVRLLFPGISASLMEEK